MDLGLKGKTAIITGGSRGIGKAVAREFGREGVDVVLVSRGIEDLEATAKELAAETGGRYIPIAADTSSDRSTTAILYEGGFGRERLDLAVDHLEADRFPAVCAGVDQRAAHVSLIE